MGTESTHQPPNDRAIKRSFDSVQRAPPLLPQSSEPQSDFRLFFFFPQKKGCVVTSAAVEFRHAAASRRKMIAASASPWGVQSSDVFGVVQPAAIFKKWKRNIPLKHPIRFNIFRILKSLRIILIYEYNCKRVSVARFFFRLCRRIRVRLSFSMQKPRIVLIKKSVSYNKIVKLFY